jgi:hypothetical protein
MRDLSGRGVHFIEGRVRCPLASIGARAAFASNRLALDDDHTKASFDDARRTLRLSNARRYAKKTLVGDLIMLGEGRTHDGRHLPLAFHTRFEKKGNAWDARPHLHPTSAARLVSVVVEPLTVLLDDGRRENVVLDEDVVRAAWRDPPLASRLGRALIAIREAPESRPGRLVLDVTIGVGPFAKRAVRVSLEGGRGARSLSDVLQSERAVLRVQASMNLPAAREHVRRALFLLGLDGEPALSALSERGLARGEALEFALHGAEGTLSYGGRAIAIPRAPDVARAYLELDFAGAILAQELRRRLEPHDAARSERMHDFAL